MALRDRSRRGNPSTGCSVQREMRRSRSLPGAAVAAVVIAGALVPASCAEVDQIVIAFRSTSGFIAWPQDPRVSYEPGAQALAGSVVTALPGAIAQVEAATYG